MSRGYIDTPIFIASSPVLFLRYIFFHPHKKQRMGWRKAAKKEKTVRRRAASNTLSTRMMAIISPLAVFWCSPPPLLTASFYPPCSLYYTLYFLIGPHLPLASCNPLSICYTALTFKPVLDGKKRTFSVKFIGTFPTSMWIFSYRSSFVCRYSCHIPARGTRSGLMERLQRHAGCIRYRSRLLTSAVS